MKKELLLFQTEIGSSEQLLYLIKSINKYSSKESLIILSEKKGFLYRSETSASIEFLKWLKVIKVKDNKIISKSKGIVPNIYCYH